jgi:hypothetical protein
VAPNEIFLDYTRSLQITIVRQQFHESYKNSAKIPRVNCEKDDPSFKLSPEGTFEISTQFHSRAFEMMMVIWEA